MLKAQRPPPSPKFEGRQTTEKVMPNWVQALLWIILGAAIKEIVGDLYKLTKLRWNSWRFDLLALLSFAVMANVYFFQKISTPVTATELRSAALDVFAAVVVFVAAIVSELSGALREALKHGAANSE